MNNNASHINNSEDAMLKTSKVPLPITASVCWALTIGMLLFLGLDVAGYIIGGVAGLLILTGIFWRPLRSGLSPAIVQLVPLWGIVAWADRVRTCRKLRAAGIYMNDDTATTIPATTRCKRDRQAIKTYTVVFDGGGQPGMSPERIQRQLELNCRVWKCRSFAFQEDSNRPGRYVIQLSTADHVRTTLDDPVIGVLDSLGAYQLPDGGWDGWEGWDDLNADK